MTTFARCLVLLVLALPSLVLAQTISVVPERASGLYAAGETIRWNVDVSSPELLRNATYAIKTGGVTTGSSGGLVLTNGKATLQATLSTPGWVLLEVKGLNASSATIQSNGGALVDAEKITPADTRPADFDDFWKAKLEQLSQVPINAQLLAGNSGVAGVDYATVKLDCINGTKVQGQLARPTTGDKFPALLIVQWAGVYGLDKAWATGQASQGWLVLNTQAHDIDPLNTTGYYEALNTGSLSNYPRIGNEDRETSYFLRMYLACHRAAEYLASRPDWDGRTLVVTGASQGGLQALVTAALHPKVTAVVCDVPAGSDQAGLDVGRLPGWPVWQWQAWDRDPAKVRKAASYYDVTHFAPMVHCPVLIATGLIDTVVPPVGVYATYNQLDGGKQILAMPLADHQNNHNAYWTAQWNWMQDARLGKLPVIASAPQATTANAGTPASLSVTASNGLVYGYQWLKDGDPIPGARKATLSFDTLSLADDAEYSVVVSSPGGSVTSAPVRLAVTPTPGTRMINIATRCFVGTESSIGVAGFVLKEPATVLVRGIGPTLENYDVQGTLQRPVLRLFNADKQVIAENTGWKTGTTDAAALSTRMHELGAFLPASDNESILYLSLPAGLYTAQLSGADSTVGNGMIEVYLDKLVNGASQDYFVNLSARCYVGIGSSIAIPSLVLDREATVLIRAVGPSLLKYDVTGVLERPVLRLYNGDKAVIAQNSGWKNNTEAHIALLTKTMEAVKAFPLSSDADSALLITLPAGIYTAHVTGANDSVGNALVEMYLVR